MIKYFFLIFANFLCACTFVQTELADPNNVPRGVRVSPSKLYIAVDEKNNFTRIFTGPDTRRSYDIRPISIFAKHEFELDVVDGQISKMRSNQDATAFLTFFKEAATLAAKAAGAAVEAQNIEGTFGLRTGIYTIDETGALVRVPGQPLSGGM